MAARTARANPEQTHRLYAALAELAGAARPVTAGSPYVAADTLVREDGTRFVWLVSQSADELTVRPSADGELHELTGGDPVVDVVIAPYGVRVLELR